MRDPGFTFRDWERHLTSRTDRTWPARRERFAVVSLVVLVHAAVLAGILMQPEMPAVQVSEMSVSFASTQAQQPAIAQAAPKPKVRDAEPAPAAPQHLPDAPPAATEAPVTPAQSAAPPALAAPDTEPDYRANYLNNPRPPYPLVARRMGYHGKVVLDVEVLADGRAGDVKLRESSGYEVLDNAAIQTVKTWRFTPARRMGEPVTQRFLVPIKFSLEDSKA